MQLQYDSNAVTLRLRASETAWASANASHALQVFVGEDCRAGRVAIAGRYTLDGTALTFTPTFDFVAGQAYVVRVRAPNAEETCTRFMIPRGDVTPARVTHVYPSGDVLPENTLRFYVHFSVPMAPGVAFKYIKLRDAQGRVDDAAFMRFKQELWNADRTRLTVLMDPGRIKREVATRQALGPALHAGRRYTLSVEAGWPTADGSATLPAFHRHFRVGSALSQRPDAKLWRIDRPRLGTREPLAVHFDRPFDRHLLSKDIRVTAAGQALDGTISIGIGERSVQFVPKTPWRDASLRITARASLEDVAGNNFNDLLDQDVTARHSTRVETERRVRLQGSRADRH